MGDTIQNKSDMYLRLQFFKLFRSDTFKTVVFSIQFWNVCKMITETRITTNVIHFVAAC